MVAAIVAGVYLTGVVAMLIVGSVTDYIGVTASHVFGWPVWGARLLGSMAYEWVREQIEGE